MLLNLIMEYASKSLYFAGLLGGSIVLIFTSIGALPALLGSRITDKTLDIGLGFSGGVMLVASFTSLLLPSIKIGGLTSTLIGFLLGVGTIMAIEKFIPHEHFIKGYEGPKEFKIKIRTIWLLVLAIIIHNFPEGLAVGSSIAIQLKTG